MTTEAVDVRAIRATVDRALRPLARPARPDMVELEQQLREHVELLLPAAEAAAEELWHGSVQWYECRAQLDRIRLDVARDLGDSPLSAHVQVRHLARDCAALLTYAEGER
ncbi:hypothetical protein DVA86_19705 [Streptomyces armeniacus]|uniref:Uncharacterized protein n=1 Tax=Streptomyces armeniacus TaxID=83291 RepID=A0A345XSC6_9ACTN|nr:hypothetical protein DVA86_19705 [Streptomyces armeniacus]